MHRLALSYFGNDFNYCLFYPTDNPDCCRTFPCIRPGVKFSKNHDFDLSGRILPDVPYLVQHRSFMPATVSDFELYLLDGGADTKESFKEFALIRTDGWAGFMAKWVDSRIKFERLLVGYEDFVSDPQGTMRRVIPFFAPDETPDEGRLVQIVKNETHVAVTKQGGEEWTANAGVKAFRKVEAFRFYDAGLFRELESIAQEKRRGIAKEAARRPLGGRFRLPLMNAIFGR